MKLIGILLSMVIFWSSCKRDDQENPTNLPDFISYVKPIWRVANYNIDYNKTNQSIGVALGNVVYKDKVFIHSIAEDGYRSITGINWQTGKVLWEWNDVFQKGKNEINLDPEQYYIYDNSLVINWGSRIYAIDVNNGQTIWKYNQSFSYYNIYGFEDRLYLNAPPKDESLKDETIIVGYKKNILLKYRLQNFNLVDSLYPHLPNSYEEGWLSATFINHNLHFKNNGELFSLIGLSNAFSNYHYDIALALYNQSEKKWIYTHKKVADKKQTNVNYKLYIYQERVYLDVNGTVNCHDLWTGERIWRVDLGAPIRYGAFIMVGDKIVCNTEAPSNSKMHCLGAANGNILWQVPSTYQTSELRHLNGIIYFSGGGYESCSCSPALRRQGGVEYISCWLRRCRRFQARYLLYRRGKRQKRKTYHPNLWPCLLHRGVSVMFKKYSQHINIHIACIILMCCYYSCVSYYVTQKPVSRSELERYKYIEVSPTDTASEVEGDVSELKDTLRTIIIRHLNLSKDLNEHFIKISASIDEKDREHTLLLKTKVLSFNKGNKLQRYLVGFGAGKAYLNIECRLVNKLNGNLLAKGQITHEISGGFFGGNAKMVKMSNEVALQINAFIRKHLKK